MPLHKCLYISIFTFLNLQRPRLQHAGNRDREPPSHPACPPRVYIKDCKTHADISKFLHPVDFLKLFFTPCLIGMLCTYTNDYANTVGPRNLPSTSHGVTPTLKSFIIYWSFEVHEYSSSSKYSEVLVKEIPLPWFVGTQLYG